MIYGVMRPAKVYHTRRCSHLRLQLKNGGVLYKFPDRDAAVKNGQFRLCHRCILEKRKRDERTIKERKERLARGPIQKWTGSHRDAAIKFPAVIKDKSGVLRLDLKRIARVSVSALGMLEKLYIAADAGVFKGKISPEQAAYIMGIVNQKSRAGILRKLKKGNLIRMAPPPIGTIQYRPWNKCISVTDFGRRCLRAWNKMKETGAKDPAPIMLTDADLLPPPIEED